MPESYKRFNLGKPKLSSIDVEKFMMLLEYATQRQHNACEKNDDLDNIIQSIENIDSTMIVKTGDHVPMQKDTVKYEVQNTQFVDIVNEIYEMDDFKLYIPKVFIAEVIRVFVMGAKKYGLDNYLMCNPSELYTFVDSAFRHLSKIMIGEYKDDESCLMHAAHVGANMAMIMAIQHKHRLMEKENGREE